MHTLFARSIRAAFCALLAGCGFSATPLLAAPDLELRMTVDAPVPTPGQPVQFTVTLTNVGADPAAGVVVTDKLPAELAIPTGMAAFVSVGSYAATTGTWSVGDLAPAASAQLVIPAVVATSTQPPCSVNVATTSLAADTQTANNRAVAAVRSSAAVRCVDLTVSGDGNVLLPCQKSRHLEMSVRVLNRGPDAATNVLVDMSQTPAVFPGLQFTGNNAPGINNCIFEGNTSYGLQNSSGITITAVNNWWGSSTGPTHISNPTGTGDAVNDGVTFSPWLTTRPR